MDIVFVAASLALLAAMVGMVLGCDKLGAPS